MAIETQGVNIFFSTSSANSTSTAVRIEEVVSFNGPTGAANQIDVSHLQSTAREFIMGLMDEGEISFSCNFTNGANQVKLRSQRAKRELSNIALGFTDPSSLLIAAKCYVTGFAISGGVDDKVGLDVTVKLTGPVTYTTYAAT